MTSEELVKELAEIEEFFNKSTSVLEEKDSQFVPVEGMFTVAQQVAEAATILRWFIDGAFSGEGFSMDFERLQSEVRAVSSLSAAREKLSAAFEYARSLAGKQSQEVLDSYFPDDDKILPGVMRSSVGRAIADHTAHHRGALTVYTRLLGKVPPMPYM